MRFKSVRGHGSDASDLCYPAARVTPRFRTFHRFTSNAAQLALFFIMSSSWMACAAAKSQKPAGVAATSESSAIIGPECTATGPTVDVAITSIHQGKPPHWTFTADLRVRNPSTVPVWLLWDVGDGDAFPSIASSVVLTRIGRRSLVWSFAGDGSFQAVRIPGGSSLVVRDAETSTSERDRLPAPVFARRISIDGQPAEQWLGRPGLLQRRAISASTSNCRRPTRSTSGTGRCSTRRPCELRYSAWATWICPRR